jgi:predicted amidohydrolase
VRIASIQLEVTDAEPRADRVRRVADLVRAQRGADLVVLPELWPTGAFAYPAWAEAGEPVDGPTVAALAAAARDLGADVHMGSIVERDGADLYNTAVLLGSDGDVRATYRKIHLFGFGEGEPTLMSAGREVVVADVAGTSVGLSTCYDLRFPEMYRALGDAGAEIVLCVAGWPAPRVEHWATLARARAIENQCVVVACNTVGTHSGHTMGGRSVIVDARGAVLAEAGTDERVLTVDLDPTDVRAWREGFPVLGDRRLG